MCDVNIISELPSEIQTEIFSYLPVDSLGRMFIVSKAISAIVSRDDVWDLAISRTFPPGSPAWAFVKDEEFSNLTGKERFRRLHADRRLIAGENWRIVLRHGCSSALVYNIHERTDKSLSFYFSHHPDLPGRVDVRSEIASYSIDCVSGAITYANPSDLTPPAPETPSSEDDRYEHLPLANKSDLNTDEFDLTVCGFKFRISEAENTNKFYIFLAGNIMDTNAVKSFLFHGTSIGWVTLIRRDALGLATLSSTTTKVDHVDKLKG